MRSRHRQTPDISRRKSISRLLVICAAVVFLVGAGTIWILSVEGVTQGSWSDLLSPVFAVLGVLFAFLQWVVPFSSEGGGESVSPISHQQVLSEIKKDLVDLTNRAQAGELDPTVDYRQEIALVIQILSRPKNNNLVLIGEPGVGKTALVRDLAQRIAAGDVLGRLAGKCLLMLDGGTFTAHVLPGGEAEQWFKALTEDISTRGNCILFVNRLHLLIGKDSGEQAAEAIEWLTSVLSRGVVQCIASSTPEGYRMVLDRAVGLREYFEEVRVSEPGPQETAAILLSMRGRIEEEQQVMITDEAITATVEMARRYLSDGFMPAKAITLLSDASRHAREQQANLPLNMREAMKGLEAVQREREQAIQQQEYELAAELRDREVILRERIALLESGWASRGGATERPFVEERDIAQAISTRLGSDPVVHGGQEEVQRFQQMEDALHQRVIGQHEAVVAVSRAIRRSRQRATRKDPGRPLGSFLFLGPLGVGKSELASALAEFLFGSEEALIKVRVSTHVERPTAARAANVSTDASGFGEEAPWIEAVRRRPHSVILMDTLENAPLSLLDLFVQILEEAYLTDSGGRMVDFRGTVVILTSSAGVAVPRRMRARIQQGGIEEIEGKLLGALKNAFASECLNSGDKVINSLDEVIVFHPLLPEEKYQILDEQLLRVREGLIEQQIELVVSQAAKDLLIDEGFDPRSGARPLRRTIQRRIEDQLAEAWRQGRVRPFDLVEAVVINGEVALRVRKR